MVPVLRARDCRDRHRGLFTRQLVVIRDDRARLGVALVAREARHAIGAVEHRPVDVLRHRNHAAGDGLLRLGVELAFGAVVVVAVVAVDAERDLHQLHRRLHQLRRQSFEHLDVLEERVGLVVAAGRFQAGQSSRSIAPRR